MTTLEQLEEEIEKIKKEIGALRLIRPGKLAIPEEFCL